ncbi:MAG: tyrosine--tRNA ligase [Planctomyces sp.]|nr:tyrosine--tRNA ligase [Planctomyces sp.]MBA4120701.1 tyrosine--tRNA ligase [Isosphaera sp.]
MDDAQFHAPFLRDLAWRGLIHQCTDPRGLDQHLSGPDPAGRRAYVGFDPTASCLTIGNLVGVMNLARWQRAGHTPVVLMGGGTGLIGDPSGKSAERALLTPEEVAANVASIRRIFARLIDLDAAAGRGLMLDNAQWLGALGYLQVLRGAGKHFSVNEMIKRDSVRARLQERDQGISYTEFSYMILQAYDFAHLHQAHGVSVQMGGSDQWGNIVSGIDLIRRRHAGPDPADGPQAFGLTWPLVTKADGGKFGKTESGAVWLLPPAPGEPAHQRTSAYGYYQFWLNTADADVARFLKTFTFMGPDEVAHLEHLTATEPAARHAQRALARSATALLHGPEGAQQAEAAAAALFSGDLASLGPETLDEALAAAPATTHDPAGLSAGLPILDLLPLTSLCKSRSEARQLLQAGAVSVNGKKADPAHRLTRADLLHGRLIVLRRGKKDWHVTRWA